jgi:UDP-N-acetylmuramoyl-L-alanyl-D-glutamate--2,6-diaminopimelate ligase
MNLSQPPASRRTLAWLLAALPSGSTCAPADAAELQITGLACDSRRVQPGYLFVAIPGVNVDGHVFLPDALARGAAAIVGQRPREALSVDTVVPYVQVGDSRQTWGWLAAAWHGHPSRQLRLIGVTGTDGKTTTVRLIAEILRAAGGRVGWISTVSARIGGEESDTGLHTTTPDALAVQDDLARMVAADTQYAVIEATSHGLAQHRVTGCDFDVAVVTNITHEHLDYHGTYEAYRAAKARLFESLSSSYRKPGTPKSAVLNADDSSYDYLQAFAADRCLSYGIKHPSDVQASDIQLAASGSSFTVVTPKGAFHVATPLVGLFNVYNALAAISVGALHDIDFAVMARGIAAVEGVIGRMERIDLGQGFTVMVDFAHTPNALDKALRTVRTLIEGQVTVVFGCAGLRDRAKRPLMGEVAGRLADRIVLTAEDPRTEDLAAIIEETAAGCERAGRREGIDYWRVPDRAEAIATAIREAQPGDLVLVTGKGHEQSMCFGTTEQPWSDHEAVRAALRERLGS